MDAINLTIQGQNRAVIADEVPILSEKTCEWLKEKYPVMAGANLNKKVVDLTRFVAAQEKVALNQTKAKIVSLLLTVVSVALFAIGLFWAISTYPVSTLSTSVVKVGIGYLCSSFINVLNLKITGMYLGERLSHSSYLMDLVLPLYSAFTAQSRLKKAVLLGREKSNTTFDAAIVAYKTNFDTCMAELHAQLNDKTTALHAWQGRVKEKVLRDDPSALNASLKELAPEGNKLVDERDVLSSAINEVRAMNDYLKTVAVV